MCRLVWAQRTQTPGKDVASCRAQVCCSNPCRFSSHCSPHVGGLNGDSSLMGRKWGRLSDSAANNWEASEGSSSLGPRSLGFLPLALYPTPSPWKYTFSKACFSARQNEKRRLIKPLQESLIQKAGPEQRECPGAPRPLQRWCVSWRLFFCPQSHSHSHCPVGPSGTLSS